MAARNLLMGAVAVLTLFAAPADAREKQQQPFAFEDSAVDAITSPELSRFTSESEFRRYLKRVAELERKRSRYSVREATPIVAFASGGEPQDETQCDPTLGECGDDGAGAADNIVVTGTRAAKPTTITNVQSAGVDEGDIVKQIGNYLITLQDGRLFVVDLKSMRLTDRSDVYRRDAKGEPIGADWYDEMLVQDDHILVAAYSYADSATELSVFSLDQASGRMSRVGVFLISSDDYYDVDNYATRIVGDKLVIYTPYDPDVIEGRSGRPVIRRWLPPGEREDAQQDGAPMFEARNIYRPMMRTLEPEIHTVSVCPLGKIARQPMIECRTTALVGPQRSEMFVSPDAVYLWMSSQSEAWTWNAPDCGPGTLAQRAEWRDVVPAAVVRIPISTGEPAVIAAQGQVFDQFSMDEQKGRFRALVDWTNFRCDRPYGGERQLSLFDTSLRDFGAVYDPLAPMRPRAVPPASDPVIENRFAGDWLVYGARRGWSGYAPDADDEPLSGTAIAVPLGHVNRAQQIALGHSVVRIERVGEDGIVATGYHDPGGLEVSMLKLGETARLSGRAKLRNRFESESRSHAFNSTARPDGSAVMGIPTVLDETRAGRWWWRSQASDLSFLAMDPTGALSDIGHLKAVPADDVEVAQGYECEVSCVDWYGNSRPIFIDERIFGLLGTQLVEARIERARIGEIGRLDLTQPIGSSPMAASGAK